MNGHEWEREVFGISSDQTEEPRVQELHAALDHVARSQDRYGWDPGRPRTNMGSKLFASVKNYLPPGDADDLRFYCAIGSSLDWHHGADGFFRVRSHVVLVDITVRPYKPRTNAIIFRMADSTCRRISTVGWRIASILNASIKKIEVRA